MFRSSVRCGMPMTTPGTIDCSQQRAIVSRPLGAKMRALRSRLMQRSLVRHLPACTSAPAPGAAIDVI
jgi:hypothetical protein